MNKLLLAASAVTLAATISPAVTSSAQAAPTKSPYCNLAKGQKNLGSWNGYYHCLNVAPQASRTLAQARPIVRRARPAYARPIYRPVRPQLAKSPYCNLAKGQKSLGSWNAYYHCLGPAPQASRTVAPARPIVRQARPAYAYARPIVREARPAYAYARPVVREARPVYAYARPLFRPVRPQLAKSPYCSFAKGQKNLVSWNAYYGCLAR